MIFYRKQKVFPQAHLIEHYNHQLALKNKNDYLALCAIFTVDSFNSVFVQCTLDRREEWSTQVLIICDKPIDAKLILVVFRGTDPFDAEDWAEDFDYTFYTHKGGNFHGKLHVGFLEDLGLGNRTNHNTINSNLHQEADLIDEEFTKISAYYLLREKLKSLTAKYPNAEIVTTGHSLGGALAITFPTVLAIHGEDDLLNKLMGVYTFGQPRIGDEETVKFMYPRLVSPNPKYYRVVYCYDIVPRLPFDDKFFAYKHFGICFYYDSFFNRYVCV